MPSFGEGLGRGGVDTLDTLTRNLAAQRLLAQQGQQQQLMFAIHAGMIRPVLDQQGRPTGTFEPGANANFEDLARIKKMYPDLAIESLQTNPGGGTTIGLRNVNQPTGTLKPGEVETEREITPQGATRKITSAPSIPFMIRQGLYGMGQKSGLLPGATPSVTGPTPPQAPITMSPVSGPMPATSMGQSSDVSNIGDQTGQDQGWMTTPTTKKRYRVLSQ